MGDVIWGLFIAAFVVLLWAAIGHLIWSVCKGLIRITFGTPCPYCQRKHLGADYCLGCHRRLIGEPEEPPPAPQKSILEDVQGARRLLEYARFRGWIEADQAESIRATLQRLGDRVATERGPLKTLSQASPVGARHDAEAWVRAELVSHPQLSPPIEPLPPLQPQLSPQLQSPQAAVAFQEAPLNAAHVSPHPLEADYGPKVAGPPRAPIQQRLTADLLKSFMEKTNIRWIELISATLIVVCSTGLVISLWSTLSQTSRFFPSLVFLLVTLAVHGAGQYTLRQWKLRSTSRGILHIGLLLIPLAVLVGILLSRRQAALPAFDLTTTVAISLGTVVYSGLAVGASRALFSRRWPLVATPVIVSSLTLLPVYYLTQHHLLDAPLAASLLIPVTALALGSSLSASASARASSAAAPGAARRMVEIVIQSSFPAIVILVLWASQAGLGAGATPGWWLAVGLVTAGWTSWGWTASLIRPAASQRAGWLAVTAWGIACFGSLLLLASVWQVAWERPALAMMLVSVGAFWVLHGWLCDLRLSLLGGAMAVLLAMVLLVEFALSSTVTITAQAWIGYHRILLMALFGSGTLLIFGWLAFGVPSIAAAETPHSASFMPRRFSSRATWRTCLQQAAVGGGMIAVASALLTVLASLLPAGETPYGGNWAAVLLMAYGCLAMAAATVACWATSRSGGFPLPVSQHNWVASFAKWLMPTAAAILVLGTVRLCQTSPMLDGVLGHLRPGSAWAVGLAVLSVLWSLLAALIRSLGWGAGSARTHAVTEVNGPLHTIDAALTPRADVALDFWRLRPEIHFLGTAALALAVISFVPLWSSDRHLQLASYLGFYLPCTAACVFVAWRAPVWREASLLAVCIWACSGVYYAGYVNGWWQVISLSTASAVYCGLLGVLCLLCEACWLGVHRYQVKSSADTAAPASWVVAGPSWASGLVVSLAWAGLLVATFIPAIAQLALSFKSGAGASTVLAGAGVEGAVEATQAAITTSGNRVLAWIPLGPQAAGTFGLALAGLTASTMGLSRLGHYRWLAVWLAALPLLTAFIGAAWVQAPWSLPIALGVLAAWLLAGDMTVWIAGRSGKPAWAGIWNQNLEILSSDVVWSRRNRLDIPSWLSLGTAFTFAALLLGSVTAVYAAITGNLASELSPLASPAATTAQRFAGMLPTLGPILLVLAVRWGASVWQAASERLIVLSGIGLGSFTGFAWSGVQVTNVNWFDGGIAWLQGTSIAAGLIAWLTVGVPAWRNLFLLRALGGVSASWSQLWSKALRGGRWLRCETAARSINFFAAGPLLLLCLTAAVLTVSYPVQRLPGIAQTGQPLSWVAFAVVTWLFGWQSLRRGMSRFALLAIALGLLAPLGSVSFAAWLMADPTRGSPGAADFQPYRCLIALWLSALSAALVVRVWAVMIGESKSAASIVEASHDGARDKRRRLPEGAVPFGLQPATMADGLWIILAVVTGGLAVVSFSHEPNRLWPLGELTFLAGLSVISGAVAGQAWRQHAAAVIAAVALAGWLWSMPGVPRLEYVWLVLWGPVWVAAVALGLRLIPPRPAAASQALRESGRKTWATVDQTVSWQVPLGGAIFSLLWIARESSAIFNPRAMASAISPPTMWTWWVLGLNVASLILALGRLWDPRPGWRGVSVYVSLIACTLTATLCFCSASGLPLPQTWLLWTVAGLTAMAIMAGLLRELVRETSRLGEAFRIGAIRGGADQYRQALIWMPALHATIALLALVPTVVLVLGFEERTMRVAATVMPLIGALSVLPIAVHRGRRSLRYCGLMLISSALVLLWWADLPSALAVAGFQETWIFVQRAFGALITLAMGHMTAAYILRERTAQVPLAPAAMGAAAGKPQLARDWEVPLLRCSWVALGLGMLLGSGLLVAQYATDWRLAAASASNGTKLMTIVAWLTLVARMLQFAVRPLGSDSRASDRTRQSAVYLAQLALVAVSAAAYFHYPQLFSGVFAQWWPVVVFGIAMLSAGLGYGLSRLGQTIVADPVRQSSLLLPIIPLAGVWWFRPQVAVWQWDDGPLYALLLLIAAGLYAFHGWKSQSLVLKSLSWALMLGSFWWYLHSRPDLSFVEHPQFWLLPPALSMLCFAEFNKQRMDPAVHLATRYTTVLIAYLSSTAEVFLNAFEGQLWQPLLLLVLALLGVAMGIALRIQAFLYCGAAFVLVALVGMVWHAQQAIGQVWPWWAFGIATGISLIVFLGYFEKNRTEVLAYLERVRQWEQ